MRIAFCLVASLSLFAACYRPDLSKVRYTCDEKNPFCPDGLACMQGCCGGPPCTKDPPPVPPGVDGSTQQDGATPLQLGPAPGCADGTGYTSSAYPKVNACSGIWPSGIINTRCASGWIQCKTAPADFCALLPGFYMARVVVAQSSPWPPDSTLRCSWEGSTQTSPRGVAGCGNSAAGGTMQVMVASPCESVAAVQPCNANGWRCPSGDPPQPADYISIANDNPQDGVLCCKP